MKKSKYYNDLMTACNKVLEYQKGNIKLKSTVIERSDDELSSPAKYYYKFEKLSDDNKKKALQYMDELVALN